MRLPGSDNQEKGLGNRRQKTSITFWGNQYHDASTASTRALHRIIPTALDKVLGMLRLRAQGIVVTPPNPDDFEEFERDLFEDIVSQRASGYQLTLLEEQGEGLAPSDKLHKLAQVAQSNGKVSGGGGPAGRRSGCRLRIILWSIKKPET